tara:strand:+ start:403 stop:1143 length:741 start_codon:yes stop_codon:yes gene_type:complete
MFSNLAYLSNLKTKKIAKGIKYIDSTNSTNIKVYEMLLKNEINVLDVLIAEQQTDGKGRRGDQWFSSRNKSLTFSFIINSNLLFINKLSLICGIAIIEGIKETSNLKCQLKWPNDVMYKNKKVGGVLIEKKRDHYIIGIGVNVNNTEFDSSIKNYATSIYTISNVETKRELLLANIFNNFERLLDMNISEIIKKWESFCNHMNTFVKFHHSKNIIEGNFSGLNKNGNAKIKINENEKVFHSGIIEL